LLILFWLNNTSTNSTLPKQEAYYTASNIHKEDKSAVCQYLLKQGKSLAGVSCITGKSRCYLKALAMKNNIPFASKPRIITDKVISDILAMAYKGFHRKAIAESFS